MPPRLVLAVLALALASAGCDLGVRSSAGGGLRFSPPLQVYDEEAGRAFVEALSQASTINVDAPGLAPEAGSAADLFFDVRRAAPLDDEAGDAAGLAPGASLVCASEEGATFSLDDFPPLPIAWRRRAGWWYAEVPAAPGVHAIRIEKPGFFPAEAQVVIPEGGALVAARLAPAVARGGVAPPEGKGRGR